ncbi:MAG: DNA-directed RNA polymerase subunit delta [bacterium]
MVRAGREKTAAQIALDHCYTILKTKNTSMNFRDLLIAGWKEAFPERELPASTLAALYTNLNLDARFSPQGKGNWGLSEWQPRPARSSVPATSLMGKSYQQDRYRLVSSMDTEEPDTDPMVAIIPDDEVDAPLLEEEWGQDEDQP